MRTGAIGNVVDGAIVNHIALLSQFYAGLVSSWFFTPVIIWSNRKNTSIWTCHPYKEWPPETSLKPFAILGEGHSYDLEGGWRLNPAQHPWNSKARLYAFLVPSSSINMSSGQKGVLPKYSHRLNVLAISGQLEKVTLIRKITLGYDWITALNW